MARRTRGPLLLPILLGAALATAPGGARGEEPPAKGNPMKEPAPAKPRRENRLARESSPYLLQHARNPVDWWPWGEEAFAEARKTGRPVFLSIGYSTCHWCHVMERESFEDEEVAAFLNARFVPVKVDREERPDVDAVYMTAIQSTGQGGGWPLSAFLDHERRPFFLGTYFPPADRYGRPGFLTVLRKIDEAWRTRREDVGRAGGEMVEFVRGAFRPGEAAALGAGTLVTAVRQFRSRFDAARGGFGEAPKFPRAHALSFLLRAEGRQGCEGAAEMALASLRAMARGGIHDQAGGGFHRYSTDGDWLVPHFEKMLYDQALLLQASVEAWQATGDEGFAALARGVAEYLHRDMEHPQGGIFSAEDADSEGVEGKFYLWTAAEMRAVLGKDAERAMRAFGVRESGNFHAEAEEAPPGANILHLPAPAGDAAPDLDRWRALLLAERGKRVRPHRDDKVLAAWNGLAISALARAGRALPAPDLVLRAGRAADFVLGRMRGPDGRLLRSWREGRTSGPGFLEDHAFLALGLLDLYEATGDPERLGQALALAREIPALFGDPDGGALFDAPAGAKDLIARTRESDDWAVPSGNAGAALLFLRLGRLAADPALEERGRAILKALSGGLDRLPMGAPFLLMALDFDLGPTREIVLAGDPSSDAFRALEREVSRRFLPRTVTAWRPTGEKGEAAARLMPWLAPYGPVDGRPAAYICTGGACKAPVTDPEALGRSLDER